MESGYQSTIPCSFVLYACRCVSNNLSDLAKHYHIIKQLGCGNAQSMGVYILYIQQILTGFVDSQCSQRGQMSAPLVADFNVLFSNQ